MQGEGEYKVGPGKPPMHTRFGAGASGNPQGKTSETKRLEMKNAETAMAIRERILAAVVRKLNPEGIAAEDVDALAISMVEAAMLKLLKDSEDRGLGAPVQALDHTSKDGTMTPKDASAAVLAALQRKHDDAG